ncbi:MAG: sodium:proton antiporter [Oligoflexia bacterium]|nr:sodium:proton antiporter [Oligoflexia bacterium]
MLPQWLMAPFGAVILSISILPSVAPGFWKKYHHLWLAMVTLPVLLLCLYVDPFSVGRTLKQLLMFCSVLACLFAIGSGLYVGGIPKANPGTNLMFFALGALLSLVIGGVGAAILLFRPILKSNMGRKHLGHLVIFFLILVCNLGGIMSPLGNSATLLAYLFGVPATWNLQLFPVWMFAFISLVSIFIAMDAYLYLRDPDFRGPSQLSKNENFRILGGWNLFWAPVPLLLIIGIQKIDLPHVWAQDVILTLSLWAITFIVRKLTPRQVDHSNEFSWNLLSEQLVIWAALFVTWIPVLSIFTKMAPQMSVDNSWNIFWLAGGFSALFNQVPVFSAFYALAKGVGDDGIMVHLVGGTEVSSVLLMAVLCSTSLFSASTYVGNVSNLLVQRQVQRENVSVPSGIKLVLVSAILVVPIAFVTAYIFFFH